MSFLSRAGLTSKTVRPVGTTLESGETASRITPRMNVAVKATIFLVLIAVSVLAFRRGSAVEFSVSSGEVWRWDDLEAPYDFSILKTAEEQEADRRDIRTLTSPIFLTDEDVTTAFREKLDSLEAGLDDVLSRFASIQINKSRGRTDLALQDSLSYARARASLAIQLSGEQIDRLYESYANNSPGISSSTRDRLNQRLDKEILGQVWNTGTPLLRRGVIDIPRDSVFATRIIARSTTTPFQAPVTLSSLMTMDEAYNAARLQFRSRYPNDRVAASVAMSMFSSSFTASHRYDRAGTEALWAEQERSLSPTINVVRVNEIIVRKGDIVTDEILQRLTSLRAEQLQRSTSSISWTRFSGQFVLTLTTYLIFFLFLFLLRRPIFDDNRMMILIALLFVAIVGSYAVALRYAILDMYVVPVAIVAIILTVIFDSRVGIFGTLTMALMGSHLLDYDFAFMYATFFACTLGIFSVRDIRKRGQFFMSAGLVLIGYVAILLATYLLQNKSWDQLRYELIFVTVNSFLLLMAYPLLWGFERVFKITTDLTLLELSDTNHPLLKEMSMLAPGTFNHVLQVANLAEAAAAAIGANSLLTRVGALYHDVGKIGKAEYFVENQGGKGNPHDHLKPSMSTLIIGSHVKEGLEIARKHRLPQSVLDFIPMHHGTTRMEYFYQRAMDQREGSDAEIHESDFRYHGPRPNSAETAILMLADTVEASARTLERPTHKRLEGLIDNMIELRRADGQLDESSLTFADLTRIRETFLTVLMGVYHVRVKYPGDGDVEREPAISGQPQVKNVRSRKRSQKSGDLSLGGDQLTEALN